VARAAEMVPAPAKLDAAAAAAVPLAGLTAWQGLFRHGQLKEGQRVLIHAASGGVGHFAVQFAKAKGARVIAMASTANVDFVRGLGADEVIDYRKERFEDKVSDVDLVFDLVGGETQERSWSVLRQGGALVSTLNEPSQDEAGAHRVRGLRYTTEPSVADLREIDALIEAGQVVPRVSRTFAFHDARGALRAVEEGHTVGKIVLVLGAEGL
jgi:NADPH:quinone reductase-like Zn-dependent oxidoreductase